MTYDPLADEWGEPMEVEVPPGGPATVLSVRLSRELVTKLRAEAERRKMPASTLVRELVEHGLDGRSDRTKFRMAAPQVSVGAGSVTLYTMGSPAMQTRSGPYVVRWNP